MTNMEQATQVNTVIEHFLMGLAHRDR